MAMKRIGILVLLIVSTQCFAQDSIDLKTLIGKPHNIARQHLDAWKVKVSWSAEYDSLLVGFDKGIQLKIKNGSVNTIWVRFTDSRTGPFPYPVDGVITPYINIKKVIEVLGNPDEKGGDFKLNNPQSGWVKWNTKAYQLHCEINDTKVTMVTIMNPDWFPGRD
jgi:hypothetical protein